MEEKNDKLIDVLLEEIPSIIGGLLTIGAGVWCVFDDVKDFGKIPDEKHPWPHHYQWGIIMIILGGITIVITIVRILRRLGKI